MNGGIQDQPRGGRSGRGLSILLPTCFVVAAALLCWAFQNFEFNPDEGGNLMKALLVNRGHALYTEVWSDQPPLFTHLLALLFRFTGPSVLGGRLLVACFSGLLLWGAYDYLRTAAGTAAAVGGCALIVVLPHFVTLGISVMIGLPALAVAVLSLAAFARWRGGGPAWLLALSAAFLALSVMIKGFTLALLPAFAAGMLLDRGLGDLRRRREALLAWSLVFSAVALAAGGLLAGTSGLGQLVAPHWMARDASFYKGIGFASAVRPAREMLVLGAAGGGLAWSKRDGCALYPALWGVSAALLLAFHRPVWFHQQLLVSIPAALLAAELFTAGPWLARCLRGGRRRSAFALALACLCLALVGRQARRTYHKAVPWLAAGDEPLQAADWRLTALMARHAAATRWVVTDRPMYAFRANLEVPPELAVVSEKRLLAGFLDGRLLMACIERYHPGQVALVRFPWPGVRPVLEARYLQIPGEQGRDLFLEPRMPVPHPRLAKTGP